MMKQKGAHKLDSKKTSKVKLPLDKPCEPPGKHPVQLRYFSSAVVGEGSNDDRRTCSHAASMPASAHDKWSRYATTVIICGPGGGYGGGGVMSGGETGRYVLQQQYLS